ncbi:MAG: ceramidase domain-containing protein [Candidatus Latescibacterota bacterium]|nr:MAG: ceramidase domain-containing protein [Candidatus Latescibacterota bacterium]
MIDIYCERHSPGLFEEPLNAITNAAFLVATVCAWKVAKRRYVHAWDIMVLLFLSATVGIGSAIWHMAATPWAKPMDLIPILLFQLWFLWLYFRDCANVSVLVSAGLLSGYSVLSILMVQVPPYFNGSILYAPTLCVLLCLAVYHYTSQQPERYLLGVGLILFLAALTFRSIDMLSCPFVPFGTHFLWHILNGALLYVVMRILIVKRGQEKPVGPLA